MNKNITINRFKSTKELFSTVALRCEHLLQIALEENAQASFIVPGGSTPAPIFLQLANSLLNWENITIAQSDERWLPVTSPQSNQALITKNLLIKQAQKANYIAMKNDHLSATSGEQECNALYREILQPFSLVMLGMGLDGHIASLFPDSYPIDAALDLHNPKICVAINADGCEVAGDYPERMSLTLPAILNSQAIVLLLTGKEKFSVIEKAMKSSQVKRFPVSALLHQKQTPVEIYYCE